MQKRKQRVEEETVRQSSNGGELRIIVAGAKAAAAKEEEETRLRKTSAGKKTGNVIVLSPAAPKQRPKSYAAPETKVVTDNETEKRSPSPRKTSRGMSLSDSEFIPPPPVLDSEQEPRTHEGTSSVSDR